MKKAQTIIMALSLYANTIVLPNHSIFSTRSFYHPFVRLSHYNDIATYFHYIRCLSESTYFLSRLQKEQYYYKPCNLVEHDDYIQIDSTVFMHQTIRSCIKKMIQTKSLTPLLILLQKVKKYSLLQDGQFFHELFLLIFTVHKQILFHECEENSHSLKKTTFETILEISEKINQLPIAEVLSAIDMLVTELPPFIEKYELHSKLTWKNWLKKYWWVPPAFGAWFGLKILLHLQRQQFYYSSYIPRPPVPLEPIITNDPALLEIRQGHYKK